MRSIEKMMNDEYLDDAKIKAVITAALQLDVTRRHPWLFKSGMQAVRRLVLVWVAARVDYQHHKLVLFTKVVPDALKRFGCDTVLDGGL